MCVSSWAEGWGLYSIWDARAHLDRQMLTGAYRLSDICDVHSCHVFMNEVEGGA